MEKSKLIVIIAIVVLAIGFVYKKNMNNFKPEQVRLTQEQMVERVHELAEKDDALLKDLQISYSIRRKHLHPESTFEVTKITINDDSIKYVEPFELHGQNAIEFTGIINDDPNLEFTGAVDNPGSNDYATTEESYFFGDTEDNIGANSIPEINWESYK